MLHVGDCREVMKTMDAESVDAICTDPPAGIAFMNREWDRDKGGRDAWVSWLTEVMREAYRVAKPGAHAVVWALPRTSGWTHRAIEDAGWDVRDCITHHFGSGFPKSKNLDGVRAGYGTALKPATEFWYLARKPLIGTVAANVARYGTGALNIDASRIGYQSDTDAEQHKANSEPWFKWERGSSILEDAKGMNTPGRIVPRSDVSIGRWPANVILSHSPLCREVGVKRVKSGDGKDWSGEKSHGTGRGAVYGETLKRKPTGKHYGYETVTAWECARDPETGSYLCPVALLDEQSGEAKSPKQTRRKETGTDFGRINDDNWQPKGCDIVVYGDTGGASRFFLNLSWQPGELDEAARMFYCAKSSRRERSAGLPEGVTNGHPTVKPLSLMSYLLKLVVPPGGTVLDPFMGSGTTGCAAAMLGIDFIGIEQDASYAEIARRRIEHWATQEQRQTSPIRRAEKPSQPACDTKGTTQLGLLVDSLSPDRAIA